MKFYATVLLLMCAGLGGCATIPLGEHQPSMDTVVLLRDSGISKLSVGDFSLGSDLPTAIDKSISVRGNTVESPNARSFALYLKESLTADLRSAGKFDPAAPLTIHAELTGNALSAAGVSEASASLAALFRVTRDQQPVYQKEFVERQTWKSAFIGAVAIPDAVNHYAEQYSRLLMQLYRDEDFRKACQ